MTDLAAAQTAPFTSFVEREGADLVLDGEPFYFNAANAPWLTHTYPSKDTVDQVMRFASDLGLDVLRTWLFSVGTPPNQWAKIHQPAPGELGQEAFEHVDYVIQQAEQHGIRLVFSLVDNWDYYGGMDQYVEWSDTASGHDDFYTDGQCRQWYKEYVRKALTRENTLTGRVYRDDPTILMWELANEAEARDAGVDVLHAWKEEMAAHVKSIDSNHLLSTGSGGEYNTDSDRWHYSGANGVDYVRNHRIDDIDVCSFHLYPEWMDENTREAGETWIREHFVDARETIGKPAFLGEFGWAKGRTPSRPTVYADWLDVVDEVDGTGVAPWQIIKEDRSETSKHDIRPSHTGTTSVLADFSSVQRGKRAGDGTSGGGGTAEESSLTGERLVVEGAGADIWNQADEFHFVHEQVSGDATLVARVASQENTDPWAKAGLMLRDSLADDAAHAMVVVTPENGVAFQHRDSAGGWTAHAGAGGRTPQLLKLERRGDTVTGYADADGSWVEVGSATVPMADPRLGLAVTSHASGTLSAAQFEEIAGACGTLQSTWTNDDVGAVDVAGNVAQADGASLAVSAGEASSVDASTATLNGDLLDLGGADAATVYFEWGVGGTGFPNATQQRTLETPGTFSTALDGLDSGTEYEFRAVAETGADRVVSGAMTFTTDAAAGTTAPSVDRFAVSDRSNPAWSRYEIDWAVSDDDGNLAAVTVELLDAGGSVADASTTGVGGASATGSDELRVKGDVSELRLTVEDADGERTTRTETLGS